MILEIRGTLRPVVTPGLSGLFLSCRLTPNGSILTYLF